VRANRTPGSVRGAPGNRCPYLDISLERKNCKCLNHAPFFGTAPAPVSHVTGSALTPVKRTLNPNLVRQEWPTHTRFPFEEHWVILRDPKDIFPQKELGIGSIRIVELPESHNTVAQLRHQLQETEAALSSLSGIAPSREPHLILTRDCFGFRGPVRILIYSDEPFSPHVVS
jgi:hypothetical protein